MSDNKDPFAVSRRLVIAAAPAHEALARCAEWMALARRSAECPESGAVPSSALGACWPWAVRRRLLPTHNANSSQVSLASHLGLKGCESG